MEQRLLEAVYDFRMGRCSDFPICCTVWWCLPVPIKRTVVNIVKLVIPSYKQTRTQNWIRLYGWGYIPCPLCSFMGHRREAISCFRCRRSDKEFCWKGDEAGRKMSIQQCIDRMSL